MSDHLEDDLLATLAGTSVVVACGGPKKVATAAGVDESNGRRWARGERANPVYRVRQMIEKATDPWTIVAYLVAIAVRAELKRSGGLVEWRWRAAYLDAIEAEASSDGHEDATTQRMLMGRAPIADQVAVDSRCASAILRRLALGIIGQQKNWSVAGVRAH